MSKLDREYRKRFEEEQFSDSLKQKGWERASAMLDKQMPVAKPSLMSKYITFISGMAIVAAGIWYVVIDGPESPEQKISESPEQSIFSIDEPIRDNEDESALPVVINTPEQTEGAKPLTKPETSPERTNHSNSASEETVADKIPEIVLNTAAPTEADENKNMKSVIPSDDKEETIPVEIADNEDIADIGVADVSETHEQETDKEVSASDEKGDLTAAQANEIASGKSVISLNEAVETTDENQGNSEKNISDNIVSEEMKLAGDVAAINHESQDKKEDPSVESVPVADDISSAPKSAELKMEHLAFTDLQSDLTGFKAQSTYGLFSAKRFSLGTWAGYAYVDKIIISEQPSYKEQREAQEQALWKFSSGFTIDYFLNKSWTAGLGIGYSEYGEQLSYVSPVVPDTAVIDGRYNSPSEFTSVTRVDSVRIIEGINKGHWDYIVYYDKKLNDSIEMVNGETFWRYIDIPLTVGYRFGKGSVRPWLKSGVIVGIPIENNVRYISSSRAYHLEDPAAAGAFQPAVQYNLQLQMGVDIYLGSNISLRLDGISAIHLNPSYKKVNISQRYYRVGVSAGLAYNF